MSSKQTAFPQPLSSLLSSHLSSLTFLPFSISTTLSLSFYSFQDVKNAAPLEPNCLRPKLNPQFSGCVTLNKLPKLSVAQFVHW